MDSPDGRATRSFLSQYGVALLSVAVAFFGRLAFDPILGDRSALDFFLVAAAASAWYGGVGPSALSLVLSLILGLWFFVPPRHSLRIGDIVDVVESLSFVFAGSAIVYFTFRMKRAIALSRGSAGEAHREVDRRKQIEQDLRHALQELETYAYSIAHNLRGPLRSVAGMSELLRDEEENLSDEGRDQLGRLMESSRRMDALILGLLDYSRASRRDLPLEKVLLADAVAEAVKIQRHDLDQHRATVTVEGDLPEIWGHRLTIVPVLTHLLSNAAKFVAPGVTPRIRIRAERLGPRVRLWVEDNGIGIDPRYHQRVFGVFEHLYPQEQYPGTGIGLAIVRKCMQRMGGEAFVESEVGKGSRFWIEAPAA